MTAVYVGEKPIATELELAEMYTLMHSAYLLAGPSEVRHFYGSILVAMRAHNQMPLEAAAKLRLKTKKMHALLNELLKDIDTPFSVF